MNKDNLWNEQNRQWILQSIAEGILPGIQICFGGSLFGDPFCLEEGGFFLLIKILHSEGKESQQDAITSVIERPHMPRI